MIRIGIGIRQVGDGPLQFFIGGFTQVFNGGGQIRADLVNGFLQRAVRFAHGLLKIAELAGQGIDIRFQEDIRADVGVRQVRNGCIGVLAQVFNGGGQIRVDLVNGFLQQLIRFCHRVTQSVLRLFQILHLGAQRLISFYKVCNIIGEVGVPFFKRCFKGGDLIPQLLDQLADHVAAHDKKAISLVGGHTSHIGSFVKRDDRKRGTLRCITAYINGNRAFRIGRRIGTSPNRAVMQVVIRIEMCCCHTSRIGFRRGKGQGNCLVFSRVHRLQVVNRHGQVLLFLNGIPHKGNAREQVVGLPADQLPVKGVVGQIGSQVLNCTRCFGACHGRRGDRGAIQAFIACGNAHIGTEAESTSARHQRHVDKAALGNRFGLFLFQRDGIGL